MSVLLTLQTSPPLAKYISDLFVFIMTSQRLLVSQSSAETPLFLPLFSPLNSRRMSARGSHQDPYLVAPLVPRCEFRPEADLGFNA